jgi:hypothetical protein
LEWPQDAVAVGRDVDRPRLCGGLCSATIWVKAALPRLKCSQVPTRCLI